MSEKSRSTLKSDADTNLADNTAGDISPSDVRTAVKDAADSNVNRTTDCTVLSLAFLLCSTAAAARAAIAIDYSTPGLIPTPAVQEYPILLRSPGAFTIASLTHRLGAGTATVRVKINGVAVTGLSAVSVSTSKTTTNATAANVVAAGDEIVLEVTAASSATNLAFTLTATAT